METLRISHCGWNYEVQDAVLLVSYAGEIQMRLPLAPQVEGRNAGILGWSRPGPEHIVGELDWLNTTKEITGIREMNACGAGMLQFLRRLSPD